MAYVPVPKDLTKVKTKVMFNLTRRQLICFGSGALIGVPLFFLLQKPLGNSTASVLVEASRVAQSARGAVVRLEKAAEKNRGKRERPSVRHRLEQASAPRTPSVSARKPHEVER